MPSKSPKEKDATDESSQTSDAKSVAADGKLNDP